MLASAARAVREVICMRHALTLFAAYVVVVASLPCSALSDAKQVGDSEMFSLFQEPLARPSDQMHDVVKTKRPPDSLCDSGYCLVETTGGQEYRGWLYRLHTDTVGIWCKKSKLVVIPESQVSAVHRCKSQWRKGMTYGSAIGMLVGWGIVYAVQHNQEVESPSKAQQLLDDAAVTVSVSGILGAFFGGLLGSTSYKCSGSFDNIDIEHMTSFQHGVKVCIICF